jgi:DNA-binding transcriptional LysR family regulator
VQDSSGQGRSLQVVATGLVAEHIAPMIDAFGARDASLDISVETVPGADFADLLEHRRADVALGPSPGPERTAIASAPFLRCRLVLVVAPGHPRAGRRDLAPADLEGERWIVGQPELDATTGTGLFFARNGIAPAQIATYSSNAAALAAAAAGEGIVLALAHSVVEEVRRHGLVRLDVRGTPVVELWHACTLGVGRALPAALALARFATTSDATQAIATGRAGSVSTRVRPKTHVTLWRGMAEGR